MLGHQVVQGMRVLSWDMALQASAPLLSGQVVLMWDPYGQAADHINELAWLLHSPFAPRHATLVAALFADLLLASLAG